VPAGWSLGQAAGHLRVSWGDFGGLVHLLPNWGASTGGCYPGAVAGSTPELPAHLGGYRTRTPSQIPLRIPSGVPSVAAFIPASPSRQPDRGDRRLWPEGDRQTNTSCPVSTAAASAMLPSPAVSPRWTFMARRALCAVPTFGQLAYSVTAGRSSVLACAALGHGVGGRRVKPIRCPR
jgi:hypothetical protein